MRCAAFDVEIVGVAHQKNIALGRAVSDAKCVPSDLRKMITVSYYIILLVFAVDRLTIGAVCNNDYGFQAHIPNDYPFP